MALYNSDRVGILTSTDVSSFRFTIVDSIWNTVRLIAYNKYEIKISNRWSVVKLSEPISSTRVVATPDTKPKTTRYSITSSEAKNQRYIFTPVNAFEVVNTIDGSIVKEYTSLRNGYYELKIAAQRYALLSLQSYTDKLIVFTPFSQKEVNTINGIFTVSKSSNRNIYADSAYANKRFVITPTYTQTSRNITTVLSKYLSLNSIELGSAQRFTSTISGVTIGDNGLYRYVVYEVTAGNSRFSKRLAYWQPKPRHLTTRKIVYKVPNYSTLNTVLMYEGTKYWIDKYIVTDWFIYNTVRFVNTRYKVATPPISIGSDNSDILYTKNHSPMCFKFNITHYNLQVVNFYDKNKVLQNFKSCGKVTVSNTTKFGAYIDHINKNEVTTYYIEAFTKEGYVPGLVYKTKRYQTSVYIKELYKNNRYIITYPDTISDRKIVVSV